MYIIVEHADFGLCHRANSAEFVGNVYQLMNSEREWFDRHGVLVLLELGSYCCTVCGISVELHECSMWNGMLCQGIGHDRIVKFLWLECQW